MDGRGSAQAAESFAVDDAEPGVGAGAVPLTPVAVDGRTARAQRTRDAIVEACVTLVKAGDIRPTAPRIAVEAGVSVRSVFQHFDDLETLFDLVAERSVAGLSDLVRPIDPDAPFEERLDAFVAQRVGILEAVTPVRRAADVHAPFSNTIRTRVAAGHAFLRAQTVSVFAAELDALPPESRERVVDMLDVAGSWSSWNMLRSLDGRSVGEAAAVVRALFETVLGGGSRDSAG